MTFATTSLQLDALQIHSRSSKLAKILSPVWGKVDIKYNIN